MKIVDEFTGRILEGRRWCEGLHQAVEAKESVQIKEENQTLATITLQNYFRLYEKLAGMTGTAMTEAGEFAAHLRPRRRADPDQPADAARDKNDLIYKTEEAKFDAVVDDIVERYEEGQPVLVGTVSVEKSERLSRAARRSGASRHGCSTPSSTRGRPRSSPRPAGSGTVTVATNMAGRGVDILLGGNPEGLARIELQQATGRPAEARATPEAEQAASRSSSRGTSPSARPRATRSASSAGSTCSAPSATSRRRIDNQLRGRSGRQGDPGESRFYLSLEDDLMRLFATGRDRAGSCGRPSPTTCRSRRRW